MDANGGQAPNAIITDQDRAIEAAVKSVFPNARHRFCLWHILKKVPEKIGHICTANPKFMFEFDEAIYDSVTIQSFEERWAHLMQKYEECNDIDWLNDLYDCREKWVPVYLKDTFFAGMSSSQRSESINHFFDGFINSKTTLKEFIDKYEDALEKRYEAENEEDNKSLQTNAFLKTSSPFERQAAGKYTRRIFKKFQSEIIEMAASNAKLVKEEDNCVTYSVKSFERIEADGINKEIIKIYTVAYDKSLDDVECQCRSFQFKGYLCRHALLVLHQNDLIRIPDKYFLKRWCKDMKYQFDEIECNTQYCDKSTRKSRYTISNPIMSYSMFCLKYIRLQEILLQIRYIVDCRYAVLSHRMMKLAEISSMSEDAFKLVMDDLTALFRRAVDANSVAKECTEPVIQDPSQITTKGRPRENRLKSGVEKKSKRSRKATDKATVDSPLQNPRSADTSKQDNSQHVIEFPQQITKRTVPYSDPFLDEFDAYVSSQVTQESV